MGLEGFCASQRVRPRSKLLDTVESEERSGIDEELKRGKDWDDGGNGDGRRTDREIIGMDRVTGIVGSTKRDKNGNRDRVGYRTQGKGRQSEAFCPTEDLFARVESVFGL